MMLERISLPHASHPVALARTVAELVRLLRSAVAGLGATLADLLVLAVLTSGLHVDARIASVPALVAGGVASFVGNRRFAFRATAGGRAALARQALLYAAVEGVALVLNGVVFDAVLRTRPECIHAYAIVRLGTSNLVFLCWSFPLWKRVFRAPAEEMSCSASEDA